MANSFVQPIEPWRLPDSEGINTSINDTNNSLFDLIYPDYSAVSDATIFQDNYMNTGTQAPPQSMMSMYVDENPEVVNINADSYDNALMSLQDTSTSQKTDRHGNTTYSGGDLSLMGAFDYADDLEPMVPDYEQSAIDRTIDSNVPEKEGFNWGSAIADGLMGYADALSNEYMYGGFGSREGNTRERLMRGRPSQAYRMGSSY